MTITTTRLRELAQAATPGPWEHVPGEPWPVSQVPYVAGPNRFGCVCQRVSLDDDAALIVALRNALPELLEALELREACERLDAASGDDRPLITWPVTWPNPANPERKPRT